MLYLVQATRTWTRNGWTQTKQYPTFLLDGDIQGIRSTTEAERIAFDILDGGRGLSVSVVEADSAKTIDIHDKE